MNEKIKKIYNKFDALQQREQVLVTGLLFVLLYVIWQTFLFDESEINIVKIKNQIKTQQQKNASMNIEIAAYRDRAVNNPNVKLKKEKKQYLNKIEILDKKLNKKMKGLIDPKKMIVILKDIFKSNKSLTLLSLEKLRTKSIFDVSDKTKSEIVSEIKVTDNISNNGNGVSAVVYRHPVKIVFTGSYLNALAYLETIEKMPWDLYWDAVELDVEKYPKAKIEITVFTLSLKKGWVGV
ncbi:MAG: hypothetical protein ACC657_01890 [Thiohalomonadales bacterium]